METRWDHDVAELLSELSSTQQELLEVLSQKRNFLVSGDREGLEALEPREQQLIERLQQCAARRSELLAHAKDDGLPSHNLRALSKALPAEQRLTLEGPLREARQRSRLLEHKSLANWVLVQRTLIHLAQLLEIIATGGRQRPTYGKGNSSTDNGSLIDQAA